MVTLGVVVICLDAFHSNVYLLLATQIRNELQCRILKMICAEGFVY
jgi:hypothetical protein